MTERQMGCASLDRGCGEMELKPYPEGLSRAGQFWRLAPAAFPRNPFWSRTWWQARLEHGDRPRNPIGHVQ